MAAPQRRTLQDILGAVVSDPLNKARKPKARTSAPRMGGGDARLMRGSTATGGRPSDSFRQETMAAQRRKTTTPNKYTQSATSPEGQLALYAAALGNKDYVSADAIRDPVIHPMGHVQGYRTVDPVANTQTVQDSTDAYNRQGFQSAVNYEAPTDDRGNPLTREYYQGQPGRSDGWETWQGHLSRHGRAGTSSPFGHQGGMTPWSTGFDRMGNELPISSFPTPSYASQFQAYPGQPDQVVPIMNPYSPYTDSAEGHALHMAPNTYNPLVGIGGGRGVDLTVSQLNAQRAANAIAARNHYNRYWNAGPGYMGGY